MRYGPSADDWDLTWETCEEEFAGYFWNHIEEQLHREEAWRYGVPGSWVEEEEEEEGSEDLDQGSYGFYIETADEDWTVG